MITKERIEALETKTSFEVPFKVSFEVDLTTNKNTIQKLLIRETNLLKTRFGELRWEGPISHLRVKFTSI